MPFFYPPPPPFLGAAQPYAPPKLAPPITNVPADQPPTTLGGPVALKALAVAIAQPNPWTYTYFGEQQPFGPLQASPGVPGQSVDRPPVSHPSRGVLAAELVTLWQPDPWTYNETSRQPFEPRKLSPGVPGQSLDAPPPSFAGPLAIKHELAWLSVPDPWVYLFAGGREPFEPRKRSPGVPGASINTPPTALGGPYALQASIVASNQPDWSTKAWPYRFLGNLQPYTARRLTPSMLGVPVRPTARGYIIL